MIDAYRLGQDYAIALNKAVKLTILKELNFLIQKDPKNSKLIRKSFKAGKEFEKKKRKGFSLVSRIEIKIWRGASPNPHTIHCLQVKGRIKCQIKQSKKNCPVFAP